MDAGALTKMFVAQVRHNLAQLTAASAKDLMAVAVAFAKYQESLQLLHKLPEMFYPKDKESQEILKRKSAKLLDRAEMDVFLSGKDDVQNEPQSSEEGETHE